MLTRLDAVPIQSDDFSEEYERWLANLVDSLNESMQQLDAGITALVVPQLTSDQITAAKPNAPNGALWYATDASPQCYVGLINGNLVKFTTTSFP